MFYRDCVLTGKLLGLRWWEGGYYIYGLNKVGVIYFIIMFVIYWVVDVVGYLFILSV